MADSDRSERDEWQKSWMQTTKPVPGTVYHYCSVDTLLKILSSKSIWLTNLFFLNDSQEHFWLRNKALAFIAGKITQCPGDSGYRHLESILRQCLRHEIYCTCFSEHSDDLSQWRGYGDDGRGFCIGFATDHLQWLCTTMDGALTDVIYDDDRQRALIEGAFELYPRSSDGEDPTIEEGSSLILGRISEAASRCKSKAFSAEAEWRVVCRPRVAGMGAGAREGAFESRFLERRGVITPFVEMPLIDGAPNLERSMRPISEIVFGPKNTSQEQRYAVELLLSRGGFRRVQLRQSELTYR